MRGNYQLFNAQFFFVMTGYCHDFKLLPCFECCMFSSGYFPASKFICWRFGTLCLFHLHRRVDMKKFHISTRLWRWNRQSVPKRRHIKFRRRGITQKIAYNRILPVVEDTVVYLDWILSVAEHTVIYHACMLLVLNTHLCIMTGYYQLLNTPMFIITTYLQFLYTQGFIMTGYYQCWTPICLS